MDDCDCGGEAEGWATFDNAADWTSAGAALACTCCAALAAGLTMGLASIDPLQLEIAKRTAMSASRRRAAEKLHRLVSQHHRLLVTLLLFNSLANEALPLFLDALVPSWAAIVLSVTLVLFCGEIIPSAIFTGPKQFEIAGHFAGLVSCMMWLLTPISWPIAAGLDWAFGAHEGLNVYSRGQIKALVAIQAEVAGRNRQRNGSGSSGGGGAHDASWGADAGGHVDEHGMVTGVLEMANKRVADTMTHLDGVYSLPSSATLGIDTMANLLHKGYSRIPVFEGGDRANIRAYLLVKRLIAVNPDDNRAVSSLVLHVPIVVGRTDSLFSLLNAFQVGKSHLAIVSDRPASTLAALRTKSAFEPGAAPVGIVTLEDVMEEAIGEEIYDEDDRRRFQSAIVDVVRARRLIRQFSGEGNKTADTISTPLLGDGTRSPDGSFTFPVLQDDSRPSDEDRVLGP